jgi:hypothetical protein
MAEVVRPDKDVANFPVEGPPGPLAGTRAHLFLYIMPSIWTMLL